MSTRKRCESHDVELDDYGVCGSCEELIQVFLRQHVLDPAAGLVALQIARYEQKITELEEAAEKFEEKAVVQGESAQEARETLMDFLNRVRDPSPVMRSVDEYTAHLIGGKEAVGKNFEVISHALRSQIERSIR